MNNDIIRDVKYKYNTLTIRAFCVSLFENSLFLRKTEQHFDVVNISGECIISLEELERDPRRIIEIYEVYLNFTTNRLVNIDSKYAQKALKFLMGEEKEEIDEEEDIIKTFLDQNPKARKEDLFQFLKTNGFEIDDDFCITDKTGELYSNVRDYKDFIFRSFVNEYRYVLTIYKTVTNTNTNTEDLVTCKEELLEIEVKKMRKKFIEI